MSKKTLKKILVAAMAMVMLFGNSLSVLAATYSFSSLPEAPGKQQVQDEDEILGGGDTFDVYIDGVLVQESATEKPITGDYYASRSGD